MHTVKYGPSNRSNDDVDEDVLEIKIEANLFASPHKRTVKSKIIKAKNRQIQSKSCRAQNPLKSIVTVPSSRISVVESEGKVTRHNFASEISVTFKNQPFSNAVASAINDKIQCEKSMSRANDSVFEKSKREIIEPVKTRIINLNNKYVKKGVCLATAVENTKFLSKNALKKITRNLNKML